MKRLTIILAALVLLTWGISKIGVPSGHFSRAQETLVLGFVILAAHTLGLILKPLGLPMVTAHLLLGMLAGPYVLGIITPESIEELSLINHIALAMIALTAGGELVMRQIRPLLASILTISISQLIIVFSLMALLFYVLLPIVPFAEGLSSGTTLAICLLVGILAVAKSPATTIAIITESGSQGRFTDTILGVTVLKDVLVILAFAVVFAASEVLVEPEAEIALTGLAKIALGLVVSVAAGGLLAAALSFALPRAGRRLPVLIAATTVVVAAMAPLLGLDPLILCIAGGFAVRNYTSRGRELIRGIESVSPMVYAVFFTMAGADLNLEALRQMWPIATALVLGRAIATFVSTWLGSRVVEDQPNMRRFGWMGFIAQAGVTLGLASLVADHFHEWGASFKTLAVAMIAVNQLAGPVLFKLALVKSGEAWSKPGSAPVSPRKSLRPVAVDAPPSQA